jgi:hypothetical protein
MVGDECKPLLADYGCVRMGWLDPCESILHVEVITRWTWHDARTVIDTANRIMLQTPHDVYTLYYFHRAACVIPLSIDFAAFNDFHDPLPPNEQLHLFVISRPLMLPLLNVIYNLTPNRERYLVTNTIEEAQQLIQMHKALVASQSR